MKKPRVLNLNQQYDIDHIAQGSKLIATLGAPGSGKSYWAKEVLKQNPSKSIVHIEKDLIRSEIDPDWEKKKPYKKLERQAAAEQKQRLIRALQDPSVDHVLVTNTHAKEEYLQELEDILLRETSLSTRHLQTILFHPRLEMCVARNRARHYPVPESIVVDMWKRVQQMAEGDYILSEDIDRRIYFVGDIHSDFGLLKKLLLQLEAEPLLSDPNLFNLPKDTFLVFLGDINDPRYSHPKEHDLSFFKVFNAIKYLCDTHQAELIQSNHQAKLISFLRGRRKKLSYGLLDTVLEFEERGLVSFDLNDDLECIPLSVVTTDAGLDIANWLDTRPYVLKVYQDQECFGAVHAQWKGSLQSWANNSKNKGIALYGTSDSEGNRNQWWKNFFSPFVTPIFGHYHICEDFKSCVCIDSGCGSDGGKLTAYNPLRNKYISV